MSEDDEVRLPGQRREAALRKAAHEGVVLSDELLRELKALAA